ncbi:uncharacterized protein B0I36DRAFT_369485 [Microdochium trichocladiopsis]|uniref:BTB domain-containing protein n=1 Tax=Microdochium trichocladiopsis TaxID=1682393 RepID=A0A9P9BIM4_9PEZI|nr:uncharacterized protein B0I36DRAFT_369485 [Microdochium trichocladiopsis]KAH7014538.1 hypothetical protein B0I36DRAFT_369485 [Microdochium trichocladiopsis]
MAELHKIAALSVTDMPLHILDKRGDLCLRVGMEAKSKTSTPCSFLVCSRALARSSPVFETMLYGGWLESRPEASAATSNWTAELPVDDAGTIEQLLSAMHGDFKFYGPINTSKSGDIRRIFELVVCAD